MKGHIKTFLSFEGWKILLSDPENGRQLAKISKLFFKKRFAYDYISNSKINKEYLSEHLKMIKKFRIASEKPYLFTPNFFKFI